MQRVRGLILFIVMVVVLAASVAQTASPKGSTVTFTGPDELDVPILKQNGVPVSTGGGGTSAEKPPVLVATTGPIALSGEQTIDTISTSGSRVLVWQQALQATNGIYVSNGGPWIPAPDADDAAELAQNFQVYVQSGTLFGDTVFRFATTGSITLGTTPLIFEPMPVPVVVPIASLPSAPVIGTIYTVEGVNRACTGPGADTRPCWWDGSLYRPVEGEEVDLTLQEALVNGNAVVLTAQVPLIYEGDVPTGSTGCSMYFEASLGWVYDNCDTRTRYQGSAKRLKTIWLHATALSPDGTQCVAATATIGGSYPDDVIICADNAAAIVYSRLLRMPRMWDCGLVYGSLTVNDPDSASQVAGWNFSSQVRNGSALSGTWGTSSNDSTATMVTASIPYSTSRQTFSAFGTCTRGSVDNYLVVRAVKDQAGSDTEDGDARIMGMMLQYRVEGDSDE